MELAFERVLHQVAAGKRWVVSRDVREAVNAALGEQAGRQSVLDAAQRKADALRVKLARAGEDNAALTERLARAAEEIATLRERLEKAEQDHNSLLTEIEGLRNENLTLGMLKGEADRDCRNAVARADRLCREHADLRKRYEEHLKYQEDYRGQAAQSREQLERIADMVRGFLYVPDEAQGEQLMPF
jgi:chromosome segregation ATPase